MNYTTLKLGGKERGAKLGIGYLKFLTESKKMTLNEVFKSINGADAYIIVPEFIYYSILFNDKRANAIVDYTLDDVIEWIDESGGVNSTAWKVFMECFTESITMQEDVESGKKKPQKEVAKV